MNPSTRPDAASRVLVWDAPLRVFHVLLAFSFLGAFVTAESERWRLVHVSLGYTAAGLVVWRLLWGWVGTRHARFADFVRGPRAVAAYLGSLLRGQPAHHVGHNPAGAWAILGLLAGTAVVAATGWATYNDIGPALLEDLHEGLAEAVLALVGVHVVGVVVASRLHRENLVRGMVDGRKRGEPADAIRRTWRPLAWLMAVAVLGFWAWQAVPSPAQQPPAAGAERNQHPSHGHRHERSHDD